MPEMRWSGRGAARYLLLRHRCCGIVKLINICAICLLYTRHFSFSLELLWVARLHVVLVIGHEQWLSLLFHLLQLFSILFDLLIPHQILFARHPAKYLVHLFLNSLYFLGAYPSQTLLEPRMVHQLYYAESLVWMRTRQRQKETFKICRYLNSSILRPLSFPQFPELGVFVLAKHPVQLILSCIRLAERRLAHEHGEEDDAQREEVCLFGVISFSFAAVLVNDFRSHVRKSPANLVMDFPFWPWSWRGTLSLHLKFVLYQNFWAKPEISEL